MAIGQVVRAGAKALSRAKIGKLASTSIEVFNSYWRGLSAQKKVAIASALVASGATATIVGLTSVTTEQEASQVLTAVAGSVLEAVENPTPAAINLVVDLLTATGEDAPKLVDLITSNAGEAKDVANDVLATALVRASAFAHTGDGMKRSSMDGLAYDRVIANMNIIKRAAAVLRLYNPEDLRAIRDVMFMDADHFDEALERV